MLKITSVQNATLDKIPLIFHYNRNVACGESKKEEKGNGIDPFQRTAMTSRPHIWENRSIAFKFFVILFTLYMYLYTSKFKVSLYILKIKPFT